MGAFLGLTLVWLIPGLIVAFTVRSRWESRPAWFLYCLLLWPAALTHRFLVPPPEGEIAASAPPPGGTTGTALVIARMKCRWCSETIRADSVTCPVCTRRLESGPVDAFDWPPWRGPDSRILAQHVAVPLRFVYVSGDERTKRRILADHLFEWAETLYVRGHEASRGATRSFRLDRMEDAVDERTGEALPGTDAIRDTLLSRSAPEPMHAPRPTTIERAVLAASNPPLAPVAMEPPPTHPALAAPLRSEWTASPRHDPPPLERPAPRRALSAFGGGAIAASVAIGATWLVFGDSADAPQRPAAARTAEIEQPAVPAEPTRAVHVPPDSLPAESAPLEPRPDRGYDAATRRSMEDLVESLRRAAETAAPVPAPAAASASRPAMASGTPRAEPVVEAVAARERSPAPLASVPPPPPRPAPPLTPNEVRELQTTLARLGYQPGPIDGIFGPRTGAALAGWQRDRELAPADHPPRTLYALMQNEVALRRALHNEAGAPAAPIP